MHTPARTRDERTPDAPPRRQERGEAPRETHPLLRMQRAAGNQAMLRMLRTDAGAAWRIQRTV